jgi:CRISPR/Cas system-associated exonuclease Cas4 (RecB family)
MFNDSSIDMRQNIYQAVYQRRIEYQDYPTINIIYKWLLSNHKADFPFDKNDLVQPLLERWRSKIEVESELFEMLFQNSDIVTKESIYQIIYKFSNEYAKGYYYDLRLRYSHRKHLTLLNWLYSNNLHCSNIDIFDKITDGVLSYYDNTYCSDEDIFKKTSDIYIYDYVYWIKSRKAEDILKFKVKIREQAIKTLFTDVEDLKTLSNDALKSIVDKYLRLYDSFFDIEDYIKLIDYIYKKEIIGQLNLINIVRKRHSDCDIIRIFMKFLNYTDAEVESYIASFYPNKKALQKINEEIGLTSKVIRNPNFNIAPNIFTATNLADFTFCNASYVLNAMYKIIFPQEHRDAKMVGEEAHTQNYLEQNLEHYRHRYNIVMRTNTHLQSVQRNAFLRLSSGKLVFSGHTDTEKKIFYSKNKKLCGIPDYIYKDENQQQFAVEEKFTFQDVSTLNQPFPNHKMQALVYLYGLDGENFTNVYLLYWQLAGNEVNSEVKVNKFTIFNIEKSDANKRLLLDTFNGMNELHNQKQMPFDTNQVNFNKCQKCDLFAVCDYRKNKRNVLDFDYKT